jgi:hypothetical protein
MLLERPEMSFEIPVQELKEAVNLLRIMGCHRLSGVQDVAAAEKLSCQARYPK